MSPIETARGAIKAALLFALVGPAIGALPWTLVFYFVERHADNAVWPHVLALGFSLGFIPSLSAGIAFVIALRSYLRDSSRSASWARLALVGAGLGAMSSTVLAVVFDFLLVIAMGVPSGALSGAICGLLCRRLTAR